MIDKAIIVFDGGGNGSYSMDWPWNDETIAHLDSTGARYAILDRNFPNAYWMDENDDCYLRDTVELTIDKPRIKSDGEDEALILGLPTQCSVMVGDTVHEVDDGEFAVLADDSGTIAIQLTGGCRSNVVLLEAVSVAELRARKWEELKAERATAMLTAPTSFGTFNSDVEGKANINGIVTGIGVIGAENHPDIEFRMADNSSRTFTPAQFVQASLEVSSHISSVYARSWALEALIDGLDDLDAIDAVTWETEVN